MAGSDLSSTEDFTSACIEFPIDDKLLFILEHSWVPERKVKVDHEKLAWYELERENRLTIVPGEYVQYEMVYEWFEAVRRIYNLHSIGYDPAKAFKLVLEMQNNGFVMNAVRQGELTLTAPWMT